MCAQAHDFEAYQELLQRETGGTAPGERYEAISKFLSETEEYLHKLTARVASVKLAQEASEAAAAAISAARLQVGLPPAAGAWIHHGPLSADSIDGPLPWQPGNTRH